MSADEKGAAALHLRDHLTDGVWHDGCGYCERRRTQGGTGVTRHHTVADTLAAEDRVRAEDGHIGGRA